MKEYCLSDKINYYELSERPRDLDIEDVKEFIKKQSEDIISRLFGTFEFYPEQLELIIRTIKDSNKELAGEKLI